jgi:hypothetical protein
MCIAPRRWQRWEDIGDLFAGRPDPEWDHHRDLIDHSLVDPWERSVEGGA